MTRILTRSTLLGLALASIAALDASKVAGQSTFTACRVPDVGAIYMIGVGGAPSACLDPSHVEFSWTEGGAPPDGSVTTTKLVDDAVTSAKIADGTIAAADIADGAVTQAKLDPGITLGVGPGDIGTTELADGAVTAPKIAADAVGTAEIADGTVATADLAGGAVTSAILANDAVTATKIAPGAVGSSEIGSAAVNTSEIADGAVTLAKMAFDPTVGCPGGTISYAGACFETSARAGQDWFDASQTCGAAGRRLPTTSELRGFRLVSGISLVGDEVTSTNFHDGVSFRYMGMSDSGGLTVNTTLDVNAFRCVESLSN